MKNWKQIVACTIVGGAIVSVCYILCWAIAEFLVEFAWRH